MGSDPDKVTHLDGGDCRMAGSPARSDLPGSDIFLRKLWKYLSNLKKRAKLEILKALLYNDFFDLIIYTNWHEICMDVL